MPRYLVNRNAQPNGDHEVHVPECDYLPEPAHRMELGYLSSCDAAVREARKHFDQVNGCYYCCRECHT